MKNNKFGILVVLLALSQFCIGQGLNLVRSIHSVDSLDTISYAFKVKPVEFYFDGSSSYRIIDITDQGPESRILNWEKVLNRTKERNGFFGQYSFEFFNTSYKINTWEFHAGFNHRSEMYAQFDQESLALVIGGNAGFLGATARFAPVQNYTSWYGIKLGANKTIRHFTIGGHIQVPFGVENLSFKGYFDIDTADDFEKISINRNVSIRSSGVLDFDGFDLITFQPSPPFSSTMNFDNLGILLGAEASWTNHQHKIGIRVSDIGFIKWARTGRTHEYTSTGLVEYDGIDLSDALNTEVELSLQDTVEVILGIEDEGIETYNSQLLKKVELSYNYQFNEKWVLGVHGFLGVDSNFHHQRISTSLHYQVLNFLNLGVVYSIDSYSYTNLGLSTWLDYNRLSIGIASQNIFGAFDPYAHNLSNISFTSQYKI